MVEHTAVNRGVVGSSPTRGADIWGISSVGRALPLQGRGHGFESHMLHLCPVRQVVQVTALSRLHHGFESRTGCL